MSYLVEQKINGKIYIYEAHGVWDKNKKQCRQKRTYIGIKDPVTGEIKTPRKSKWSKRISFNHGAIKAVESAVIKSSLKNILDDAFSEDVRRILALAAYTAVENKPMCYFENWAEATEGMQHLSMSSQEISAFLCKLGKNQYERAVFWQKWAKAHGLGRNLIFDVTSISTYAVGIENAEFGYNRDGESLPQTNIGLLFSDTKTFPIAYKTYPGSIGDISTMNNLIAHMKNDLQVEHKRLIIDKGFHSNANLQALDMAGYDFIIPMPMGLVVAKDLLAATKSSFDDPHKYFLYGDRLMGHAMRRVTHAGRARDAHVFVDFARRTDEMSALLMKLEQVDCRLRERDEGDVFQSREDAVEFLDSINSGLSKLYEIYVEKRKVRVRRSEVAIDNHSLRFGKMILVPSEAGMSGLAVLEEYMKRDSVEKSFDVLKNGMDFKRGRVHSQESFDGRLFIHMLGLIIQGVLRNSLAHSKLSGKISYPEMIQELNKLKVTHCLDGKAVLGEVSRKQKDIFKALEMEVPASSLLL